MGSFGGKPDLSELSTETGQDQLAKNGLSQLLKSNRNVAHRDADGGSRPLHRQQSLRVDDVLALAVSRFMGGVSKSA
jgi:hypothetical protein